MINGLLFKTLLEMSSASVNNNIMSTSPLNINTKSIYDAIIVGAGPAGMSTALALAKSGQRVAVIERMSIPRNKVCGGFIGFENKEILDGYGVWNEVCQKGELLKSIRIHAGSGLSSVLNHNDQPLGIGMSRSLFDQILVERARTMGVTVIDHATHTIKMSGKLKICAVHHVVKDQILELKARCFIDASGVHQDQIKRHRHFGAYALFKTVYPMHNDVALYCIKGGHLGVNRFEDGLTNFCYAVNEKCFQNNRGQMRSVLQNFIKIYPELSMLLNGADQMTPFKGISFGQTGKFNFMNHRTFLAGDRVAIINPIVGGGNSIALASGFLLADTLLRAKVSQLDFKEIEVLYEHRWRKAFANRVRWSWLWGRLAHQPVFARWCVMLMNSHRHFSSSIFQQAHQRLHLNDTYLDQRTIYAPIL
jgi:flavin-dependent dehydrogenase